MKVLVACEYSGITRNAFTLLGHDVTSCDLLATDVPGNHYQGDVEDIINNGYDLMIAHPPCTYLCSAGNRWFNPEYSLKYPTRLQDRQHAVDFFMMLVSASIERIAIENPVGIMSTAYRKPNQIIQPYEFGHPHAKKTCLWLKNLPPLRPTKIVEPEYITYKSGRKIPKWYSNLSKTERSKERSKTFVGIATAMAEQWGSL